ncbi:hypothetical protein [Macrococcoides caseolyticum]|uniref:hypothetical protein n=1 Tax=Macrococcoides caseolyticum TaxID=69966 RepID=UPI000C349041|nr:hypothetical protein [Macrococcus caseolyticus]PKE48835.1 hypothetical protein CW677_01440 [Macrococcus caseolyticus]PKF15799.1 hypothetical protein CW690_01440 [Macrococcus caseolyticus]
MQKISRKEYMKEYRKRNAERMKELNRINYLKRKEKLQKVKTDDTILRLIQARKQERVINMSVHRKRRRKRLQEAIKHELMMC